MVVVGRVCATQVSGVHGHVPAEVAVDSCLWRIVVWLYVLFDCSSLVLYPNKHCANTSVSLSHVVFLVFNASQSLL